MAEYIELEAAFNAITDLAGEASTRSAYEAIWESARALKKIPAADVAPVVRCRECKYYKPDEFECECDFAGGLPYVKADDFCSYGERKEE